MNSIKEPHNRQNRGDGPHVAADPLQKALRRIRRTRGFPSISKYVVEINQKLMDTSVHASASELANIILKDYALTNKLLKLVNSAFYGLVAGKVTTVTRAVVLLGHDKVRLAALSLVLFEYFKSKTSVKDLKDATLRSLWCGLLAREIARMKNGIDAEEAFICGLLHQLGQLLVICHMPHDYREIQYHIIQKGEKEVKAVKRILGVSYRALGVAVAKQWNFPESIQKTMAAISIEELQDKRRRINPVWVLASFSNALERIVREVKPAKRKLAIEHLLSHYHYYINLSAEQILGTMADCLDELYGQADALQFDVVQSDFISRFRGDSPEDPKPAVDAVVDHSDTHSAPAYQLTGDEDLTAVSTNSTGEDAVSIIMGGIQELSNSMVGEFDLSDIALMSLEVIYRAVQCQRAILFINERRNQIMEARFGYGKGIQQIVGNVQFKMDGSEDLFSQAIRSDKDLIVDDGHAPELFALIPKWYRKGIDARAFVFLPVVFKQVCVGAYYADMASVGSIINEQEHRYLAMLRNQLILAIKMGR